MVPGTIKKVGAMDNRGGKGSARGSSLAVDLIDGPIMKNLLIFMIPILVSYLFQQLYNAADTAIVGHYLGEQSLAAVGASVAVFDLMVGFAQGLGNGLSIVVSRAYGAGDEAELRKAVAGATVIGAVTIGAVTVLALAGLGPLLHILGTPAQIYAEALSYIRIIGGCIVVMFAYNLLWPEPASVCGGRPLQLSSRRASVRCCAHSTSPTVPKYCSPGSMTSPAGEHCTGSSPDRVTQWRS